MAGDPIASTEHHFADLDDPRIDRTKLHKLLDMVSAWATANHLVLGQVKVDKSNEIGAIPELLRVLEISGCIITIDAIGCQKEIAADIVRQEAEYVLALKDNQGNLYQDVELLFDDLETSGFSAYECNQFWTVNKGHGRIEIRQCWSISDRDVLRCLRGMKDWQQLFLRVQTARSCAVLPRRLAALQGHGDASRQVWYPEKEVGFRGRSSSVALEDSSYVISSGPFKGGLLRCVCPR